MSTQQNRLFWLDMFYKQPTENKIKKVSNCKLTVPRVKLLGHNVGNFSGICWSNLHDLWGVPLAIPHHAINHYCSWRLFGPL